MKQDQMIMLVVAFLLGLFFKQLMGQVCGGNLVEGVATAAQVDPYVCTKTGVSGHPCECCPGNLTTETRNLHGWEDRPNQHMCSSLPGGGPARGRWNEEDPPTAQCNAT